MRGNLHFAVTALLCSGMMLGMTGCHSPFVDATVINHTGAPVHLLEIDYPSASFGTQDLPAGRSFHYRFKILGSGTAKALWTDATKKDHTSPGPVLSEGQEGQMTVTLMPDEAQWKVRLHPLGK